MEKMMYIMIIICKLCSILPDVGSLEIKGTYHTWLITVPLPVSLVQQMLPEEVSLIPPVEFPLPSDTHPILLELGREINCGPSAFKFLQTNFMEAKFDIPFLALAGRHGTYNLKQFVYVDNIIQSIGAAVSYKLNSRKADMTMSDSQYSIGYNDSSLLMNKSDASSWGSIADFPNFDFYQAILNQTWFGKDVNVCGQHSYNFSNARIRPIKGSLEVSRGIFNNHFPSSSFVIEGLNQQPFGAVEAIMDFIIASPQKC